jgi:polysaccharide export outer membrane protein
MRKLINILLFFLLFFTSCVTTRELYYLQSPQKGINTIPSYKDSIPYQEKTSTLFNGGPSSGGMNMMLSSNSENIDLFAYIVSEKGTIHLPILGDLYVLGKTIRETKYFIEESLKEILPFNSVDVRLLGRYFSIIGGGSSGRFPMVKEKINIFQAIAMSGDFGFYVNRSKVRIIRLTPKGTVIKMLDIRSADIIHSEYYYIEPNDVIYLEPLNAQFFGVTNVWTFLSTVITTFSFGLLVYKIIVPTN